MAGHHTGSASHIHGDVAGATDLPARTSLTMLGGGNILDSDTPTDVDALCSPTPSPYYASLSPTNKHSFDDMPAAPRHGAASIPSPSLPAAHIPPVNDEDHQTPVNSFDSTTILVIRNGFYTDTLEHTANSHSHTSLLQSTLTPILPLSSISRSNRTDSSQLDEKSAAAPLPTFSYPPSSSIPSSTSNTPAASALVRLPTSAGDDIPTMLVCSSFDLNHRSITHPFVGHFQF